MSHPGITGGSSDTKYSIRHTPTRTPVSFTRKDYPAMQLKIDISLKGDHMQELTGGSRPSSGQEVFTILREVSILANGHILDVNGNTIGTWRVTR